MKILFMGTPDFALASLRALKEAGETIVGVVTQPDKPKGRGYTLTPPPVKVYALEQGWPVYQPTTLRDEAFAALLDQIAPDMIVVVAYGKILPSSVIDYPRYGCINVHGSLLPRYRGAAPMQRAILEGEAVTGITTMYMDAGLDTGDMLCRAEYPIGPDDTFEDVHDGLAALGARVLCETVSLIRDGKQVRTPQDHAAMTYAAKLEKEDCVLSFADTARALHNRIRALSPMPLAFTHLPDGKRLKVVKSRLVTDTGTSGAAPGTVLEAGEEILVQCGEGTIALCTVLPEGKGRMSAADFVRGRQIGKGDRLS